MAFVAVGALAITAGDDTDSRLQVGTTPQTQPSGDPAPPVQSPGEDTPIPPPQVEPDTGLVSLQAVTVTADDFPEGTGVWVVQCGTDELAAGRVEAACDRGWTVMAQPDAQGLTATTHVRRAIHIAASGWVDCTAAPGRCALAVGSLGDREGAWSEISFATDPVPTDGPTIEVRNVPAGPGGVVRVRDGTTVAVTGAGFPAGAQVGAVLCPPKSDCGPHQATETVADDGTFVAEIPIEASRTVNGVELECAKGCRIRVTGTEPPGPDVEPIPRVEGIPVVVTRG